MDVEVVYYILYFISEFNIFSTFNALGTPLGRIIFNISAAKLNINSVQIVIHKELINVKIIY